jgi:hypothetical protein
MKQINGIHYLSNFLGFVIFLFCVSCNNDGSNNNPSDSTKATHPTLAPIKVYGATLDATAIREFYPVKNYPNFDHFLFSHQKDAAGDYYVKVFAVEKNGNVIKEVTIAKDGPPAPINFTVFEPLDIKIGVERQLGRLSIPSGEEIKSLSISPKKYQKHIGYKVRIQTDKALTIFNKEINPSPPAMADENDWGLQP